MSEKKRIFKEIEIFDVFDCDSLTKNSETPIKQPKSDFHSSEKSCFRIEDEKRTTLKFFEQSKKNQGRTNNNSFLGKRNSNFGSKGAKGYCDN